MSARDPLCRALEDPTATCVSLPWGWGYPVHGSRKQLPHSSRWYTVQCNLPPHVSRPAGRSGGHLEDPVVHISSNPEKKKKEKRKKKGKGKRKRKNNNKNKNEKKNKKRKKQKGKRKRKRLKIRIRKKKKQRSVKQNEKV